MDHCINILDAEERVEGGQSLQNGHEEEKYTNSHSDANTPEANTPDDEGIFIKSLLDHV